METESFLNEGPGCKLFLTLWVSLSSHSSYADKKKNEKRAQTGDTATNNKGTKNDFKFRV